MEDTESLRAEVTYDQQLGSCPTVPPNEEQSDKDGEDGVDGPSIFKHSTPADLAAFEAAQARAGIIYISRIPPGMRPPKLRRLMSRHGQIGRSFLQQEDGKRAQLRRKYTSTKKAQYTEGWVEFLDKRVARAVAEMLNGQPIGGKKGNRFRDDIWTMKYLPRFKWNMLNEQIAHEQASRTARLRHELSQSKKEQNEYLRNVELARGLAKRKEREERKRRKMEEGTPVVELASFGTSTGDAKMKDGFAQMPMKKKKITDASAARDIDDILGKVF